MTWWRKCRKRLSEMERSKLSLLVFDEEKAFANMVERLDNFFKITKDGTVLLKKDIQEKLYLILVYLIGRRVAKILELIKEDAFTLGELSVLTGLSSQRLVELLSKSKYITYVGRGSYSLNSLFIEEILDELEKLYTSKMENAI